MPFENTYIKKVLDSERILTDTSHIYTFQWKWKNYFSNTGSISLEIGTGMGNFFAKQVQENHQINFIWMEIKWKRLHVTDKKAGNTWNKNYVLLKDMAQNIHLIFWKEEITNTYIYFPDPWTKKPNQQKNQLITQDFLQNLLQITKLTGTVEIKTDDETYFEIIKQNFWWTSWKIIKQIWDYEQENTDFKKENITEFEWIWRGKNKKIWLIKATRIKI